MFGRRQRFNSHGIQMPLFDIIQNFPLCHMPFQIGKFIQPGKKTFVCTFAYRNALPILNHQNSSVFNFSWLFGSFHRKLHDTALFLGKADLPQRAVLTFCHAIWHTDNCAKFHQSLVVISRAVLWHDFQKLLFHFFSHRLLHDVLVGFCHARDDAQYISIDRRHRNPIRNGGNRTCRVIADSRQPFQFFIICRQRSPILLHHFPGSFLHIAHTVVVAKALPQLQKFFFRTGGKMRHIRQFLKETVKIRFDRLYPGLLEHNLRYPGHIRIVFISPRKVSFIFSVPFQQRLFDLL